MTNTIAAQIIIRAILQAIAGILLAKGYIKPGAINIEELSGAILIIGTIVWSWWSKHKLIQQTPTDNAKE